MKEITRVNHVGLRVRDLEISQSFYKKLGFLFIVGPIGPEPVAIMKHPSGVNINFILNTSKNASPTNILMDMPEKYTGYTHIAWEITDSESVEKQLKDQGIEITEKVEFEGAKFFFIRDPDGNVIEFHKPASSIKKYRKNQGVG
jgi:lactoylglutathione lyase